MCVCLCASPACSPPFLAGICCVGVRAAARVSAVPRLSWVVGVFFIWGGRVLLLPCGVGRCLSLSRGLWSLSPHSLPFGLGCWLFFFWSHRGVCLRVLGVLLPGGPLLLSWCCQFWLGGPPVPLWGVSSSVPSGWGVWPPLAVLVGGLVAVGRSVALPPVCLFLPLPSLGWRTHWPAFSVVFRVAVGGCVLLGRVPAPWVGWVMYTLGSAPLPAGLGSGSADWAPAPGGFVRLWVRGLGLSVSFLLRGAGSNPPGWTATVVAGRAVAPYVARRAGVWRAGAAPFGVCVGLFWLVLQVGVSRAMLCRSVPRGVALCCGLLRFGVRCRGALHCGALRCGVPCCLLLCCGGSVEVSLACVAMRSAGRSVAGWWLGGAVRCGWIAGSVLWGPGRAARAGGSGRCPRGCPPWGPVPWSRVLWGSWCLAPGAVAVPSSSSGVCEVALVVAGVVAWR